MQGLDTVEVKHFLKAMTRRKVGHPSREGEFVRVEEVKRSYWTYREGGEIVVVPFSAMSEESIRLVMG